MAGNVPEEASTGLKGRRKPNGVVFANGFENLNGNGGVTRRSVNDANGTNGINGTNGRPATPGAGYSANSSSAGSSSPGGYSLHRAMTSPTTSAEMREDVNHLLDPNNSQPPDKSHRIPSFSAHKKSAAGPQSRASAKIQSYTDNPGDRAFPRISRPVELLRSSYDTIVIGSGYGGGVAASRMARAGESVCLLERGKERWPGEYPSGLVDVVKQLHVSGEFAPGLLDGIAVESGDPTGLYHLICGKGQNAFVGNGLGGTSLLNANVFLEADHHTLGMSCWPEELRQSGTLDPYYARATKVLEPRKYPKDWPELRKLTMLERQAKALNLEDNFYRVPQTTRFSGGPNSTGVEMYPSALTGMDSTGVNDGSKSSTLVNYLSDAWNWGAEMFCECEVRYIKKHPDPNENGYLVFFAWHGAKRESFSENLYDDLMWVHAKKCVFLGAGSIGTTEILLRSKSLGLNMSSTVGTQMSGNGDILAFGYNTEEEVNSVGSAFPSPYNPVGPTIAGVIDCREGHKNPLDGFVIEEGAVPKALAPLLQTMLELMPGKAHPENLSLFQKVERALAAEGSRFLGPYFSHGSIEKTQVYLVMSHDANQAILTLKDDKPVLEFLGVGRSDHVDYLNTLLRRATEAVGGTFIQSPFYAALGQQEITVHPIGGACMASDGTCDTGVTNHAGEVFTGHGSEVYPGLMVTDGAVIPAALGVNPFATITALAERSVQLAAERLGLTIDFDTSNGLLDLFGEPRNTPEKRLLRTHPDNAEEILLAAAKSEIAEAQANHSSGFGFSEIMSGFIHVGDNMVNDKQEDFRLAAKTAKGLCEAARFFLSVKSWDTAHTVRRSDHSAMLTGTFVCASLPGSPFMVQRGAFRLFSADLKAPGTRNLAYDFDMTSIDGRQLHFHGYKIVDSSVALGPLRFWEAASTLYVTISDRSGEHEKVLGRGTLHINPMDFVSEMFSLQPSGRTFWSKLTSTASFLGYFVKQSASLFFGPLTSLQYPAVSYTGYINDTPPDKSYRIIASDGIATFMHMWEPKNKNLEAKNLFFIPGASVDHQIFALPTIEVNAVNYFTRAGYRVYVTVHRICQVMEAENGWTTFDSRLDIRECIKCIREIHGPEKLYCVTHCMGGVAFASGLLDGQIPTDWIKGITCSQVFMNPLWSILGMCKATIGPVPMDRIYKLLAGSWFSCSSSKEDSYRQQLLNQLLRFYPDTRSEMCNNVSCHRCSLVFGRLWNHRNLNEATHRQINRFFGGVNMTLLHLLMHMGTRGVTCTNGPLFTPLTTPHNINRLRGIPIMLFSGSDNKVLSPANTELSYTTLRDTFGADSDLYERHVIQGYGHLDCWMGRHAYMDVYPIVREEIDKVCRGRDYRYVEQEWDGDWKRRMDREEQVTDVGAEVDFMM